MQRSFGNVGTVYRIGTWNVRFVTNEESKVTLEMNQYSLNVLRLSETKARGNGMKMIDETSYVYAGVTEGRAKGGVSIVIAERWADCVKSWRFISERCVSVRMKIAGVWLTLVQVYAPRDDKNNDIKDEFYTVLQEVVDKAPRGDKVVVMGDFNARVSNNVARWEVVIEKQVEAVANDSGRRLLSFSAENSFKILNTFYEHKEIHKYT